jgi:hypothetical protein
MANCLSIFLNLKLHIVFFNQTSEKIYLCDTVQKVHGEDHLIGKNKTLSL